MKLKEYNIDNVILQRNTTPSVHINTKTGLFNFNKTGCDLVGLKENDQIKLHQDEDDEQNWYLEKVKQGGFVLRVNHNLTAGLFLNNTQLARMIFKSVDCDKLSGRILIAGKVTEFDKRKFWGLITARLAVEV